MKNQGRFIPQITFNSLTTTVNGKETTVDYPKITQTLAIKTRELGPKALGQEYRGNDVKMLEQVVRMN